MLDEDTVTAPLSLGHTMSHVSGALYVFGGIKHTQVTNSMHRFHIQSATWTPIKTDGQPPPPRYA